MIYKNMRIYLLPIITHALPLNKNLRRELINKFSLIFLMYFKIN